MPETRGYSLEMITESFHQHLALDTALIRLPHVVFRYIRKLVIQQKARWHPRDTETASQNRVELSSVSLAS